MVNLQLSDLINVATLPCDIHVELYM